jgi:hypothetical protein
MAVSRKLQWLPQAPQAPHIERSRQFRYLPQLNVAASAGLLRPYLSDAIVVEHSVGAKNPFWNMFGLDLQDIPVLSSGIALPPRYTRQNIKEALSPKAVSNVSERSAELVRFIGEKHSADCLHLYTAERHGIEIFLTNDRKFRHAFENSLSRHKSPVRVSDPAELMNSLGFAAASDDEFTKIRDMFRQQILVPQCQFRWPKSLVRRFVLLARGQIEFTPFHHGELVIPPAEELRRAVLATELKARRQGLASRAASRWPSSEG